MPFLAPLGAALATPAGAAVAGGLVSTAGGLIANNQANKAAQAAANAAQIDPVEQARRSLQLQMEYAPQLLALEQQLQPGYADLSNQILQQRLVGDGSSFDAMGYFRTLTPEGQRQVQAEAQAQGKSIGDWLTGHIQTQAANGERWSTQALQNYTMQDPNSLLGIYQAAQPALSNLAAQNNTAQRTADVADVENLGARASEAYRAANPQLTAATDTLSQRIAAARNVTPGAVPTERATQQVATGSALMPTLEGDATSALNARTALQNELESQTLAELKTGGRLSDEAARSADQAVRAAAADRGMVLSNSTIFNEALNRDNLVRARQGENIARGLAVDAAGQQQTNAARDYALNVAGQGNALSTFNAGQGNALSTFNAGQGNQMAQFNAELDRALTNDQFGREFALTQLLQSQSLDPYSLVLGRGTSSPQAPSAVGQAGSLTAGPQYSTLFDPTLSSIANFNANAAAAAGNARANNFGALSGTLFGGGLDLFGDAIGAGLFGGGG